MLSLKHKPRGLHGFVVCMFACKTNYVDSLRLLLRRFWDKSRGAPTCSTCIASSFWLPYIDICYKPAKVEFPWEGSTVSKTSDEVIDDEKVCREYWKYVGQKSIKIIYSTVIFMHFQKDGMTQCRLLSCRFIVGGDLLEGQLYWWTQEGLKWQFIYTHIYACVLSLHQKNVCMYSSIDP